MRAADWLLRLAVLLHACGLARALFTRVGSSIGSIALMHWDVAHAQILLAEKFAASVVVLAAVTVLIRPTLVALLLISGMIFIEALAALWAGGFHFFQLTPYAQALRYLTPLALIPLVPRLRVPGSDAARRRLSAWVLRLAIAMVFVTHGYEAWKLHPHFLDFVLVAGRDLAGIDMAESAAAVILRIIGVVDFVVAAWVLLRPNRPLLLWLGFWGLITALARPVTLGFASYPEVLLRASHVLAPIALGLLLLRRRPPVNPPEDNQSTGDPRSAADVGVHPRGERP